MDEVMEFPAPGACTVDTRSGMILARAPAQPDVSAVVDLLDRILVLCGEHPGTDLCMDFRGWDARCLTPEQVGRYRSLNDRIAHLLPGSRTAIVVDSDLAYGLGRMYEVVGAGERFEVRVFREARDAMAWLRAVRGRAASAG